MECPIIELQGLKKYYGKKRGIEDVSIKINKGEIYGFIGPNGAGKSTTIRTLIGLIKKNDGHILFNGKELEFDDIEFKKKIGYLPSEVHLYEGFSVKQTFDYHETFYDKDCSERRKELVEMLKIDEEKRVEDLSLGNQKKVGIVLALMHEPEIVILDEATSGLDPIMQNIFHNILLKEKEKGVTILYSSHILSEVSSICDKVGFIKDGVIIKEDLIDNIKKDNFTYLVITSNEIDKIKEELNLKIVKEEENTVTFINDLDTNSLISKLSKYNVERLLIEEISLEDLFINYYM